MAPPPAKVDDLIARMTALYPRTHGPECPDRYRAIAEWWRLHAQETMAPDECLTSAAAQDALATDMEVRPGHYRRKPEWLTAHEWSRK